MRRLGSYRDGGFRHERKLSSILQLRGQGSRRNSQIGRGREIRRAAWFCVSTWVHSRVTVAGSLLAGTAGGGPGCTQRVSNFWTRPSAYHDQLAGANPHGSDRRDPAPRARCRSCVNAPTLAVVRGGCDRAVFRYDVGIVDTACRTGGAQPHERRRRAVLGLEVLLRQHRRFGFMVGDRLKPNGFRPRQRRRGRRRSSM
jgi:hypothetical protein